MDPTERHYKHATHLSVELYNKYLKGAAEHSGYLPEMAVDQLLDEAIAEVIDQFVYLMTLKEKLQDKRFSNA